MPRSVLVFGGTSAVAQGVCRRMYEEYDCEFFLVGRNSDKLHETCRVLSKVSGHFCCDLENVSSDSIQEIFDRASHALSEPLDTILVAHGDLFDQEKSEVDAQTLVQSLHLNAVSAMIIATQTIALAKERGLPKLKLGVITSVAGQRGRPRNFTYGAAKGALSLFLQGLRSVHYKTTYEIYDFRLGPVDTPMTISHAKNFSFSTVDKVAEIISAKFKTKQYVSYVPGYWFWVMLVVRLLPEPIFQKLKFLSDR